MGGEASVGALDREEALVMNHGGGKDGTGQVEEVPIKLAGTADRELHHPVDGLDQLRVVLHPDALPDPAASLLQRGQDPLPALGDVHDDRGLPEKIQVVCGIGDLQRQGALEPRPPARPPGADARHLEIAHMVQLEGEPRDVHCRAGQVLQGLGQIVIRWVRAVHVCQNSLRSGHVACHGQGLAVFDREILVLRGIPE